MLGQYPRPGGLAEHARIMARLATALADAAILTWVEKERYGYWRPVSAIEEATNEHRGWRPLVGTPGHPEYPSGHASDCFTGAAVLISSFPEVRSPVTYIAQAGHPPQESVGMGQHAQIAATEAAPHRTFPSLAAAAEECANSRIWSGAHFRPAAEESRRIGEAISRRAMAAVP